VRFVRGHGEVRRFPSRHDHGLFRLVSYLRLGNVKHEPHDGILIIERQQSNLETWTVGVWIMLTVTGYVASLLPAWPLPLALLAAVPLALLGVQVFLVLAGVTIVPAWNAIARAGTRPAHVNNVFFILTMIGASLYFATRTTWVRFVAWQFLAVLVLNALSAGIVFLLRDSIAQLEASIGGSASGQ
jgi:hypothetical protein